MAPPHSTGCPANVLCADDVRRNRGRSRQITVERLDVGAGIGNKVGGSGSAFFGAPVGGLIGNILVDPLARNMASPFRLLEKAEKAKILSKQAQELAGDLNFMQKKFGVEGANRFVNGVVAGTPALNELAIYINSQKEGQ